MFDLLNEDIVISGQRVRKGELIKMNVTTANLDPTIFPEPLVFDMDRPNLKEAFMFGAGPHFCVGAGLAKYIGISFIRQFIERYPNAEIISEPTYEKDFINREMVSLPVKANLH